MGGNGRSGKSEKNRTSWRHCHCSDLLIPSTDPFGRIESIHIAQIVYTGTPGSPLIRRRILVVDDDTDLRQMYQLALALAGFDVMGASNGIDALGIVEQHPPDLVILDLGLPLLDGFAVQQEIAAQAATRHIPIVVVTGLDVDASSLDVPRLLKKPVTPDEVVRIVWQCLGSSLSNA
jgi:CheY-like chemotaxis protein